MQATSFAKAALREKKESRYRASCACQVNSARAKLVLIVKIAPLGSTSRLLAHRTAFRVSVSGDIFSDFFLTELHFFSIFCMLTFSISNVYFFKYI